MSPTGDLLVTSIFAGVTDNITRIYTTGRNILGFKYFFASLGNQRKLSQE